MSERREIFFLSAGPRIASWCLIELRRSSSPRAAYGGIRIGEIETGIAPRMFAQTMFVVTL